MSLWHKRPYKTADRLPTMSLNRPICILSLLLVCIPAHAKPASIPKIPKNPSTLALELATGAILQGIGWVMDEGVKTHQIPDTATADNTHTDAPSVSTDAQIKPQVHSLEYLIDGKSFGSAEDACNYMFGDYLTKNGYKLTRRSDGTYLKSVDVYLGDNRFSSMGFFRCHANIGYAGTNYDYNIGGWTVSYDGNIVYKGTDSTVRVTMTDAYKQRRDEARKAVEQAIVNARANAGVTDATPQELPQDKDKPKPVPVPAQIPNEVPNEATDEATQVQTLPTPKDPPKPFEVPKFCTWASSVCNFMDWVRQEPTDKPQDLVIPKKEINLKNPADFDKNYIAVNDKCPADIVKDFDTGFKKEQIVISFSPICSTIYDYFRPVIIFLAYIGAIFVISSAFKIG